MTTSKYVGKSSLTAVGLMLLVTAGVAPVRAAVSDLAAGFSDTSNPSGDWAYGYLSSNGSFNQDQDNLTFLETGNLPAGSPGFVAYDTFAGGGVGGGEGWTTGLGFPFAGQLVVPSSAIPHSSGLEFGGLTDWPSSAGDNPSYPNGIIGGHGPNTTFSSGWYGVKYTATTSGPVDIEMKAWQTAIYPDVPPNPTFGGATRHQQVRIDHVVGGNRNNLVQASLVSRHGVTNITGTPQYTAADAPTPGNAQSFATQEDEIDAAMRSSARPNLYRITDLHLDAGESIIISLASQAGLNYLGFHGFNVVVRTGEDRIATTRWDLSDDWNVAGSSATGIGPDGTWSYGILSNGGFSPYDRVVTGFRPNDPNTPERENHGWGTQDPGWFVSGVTDPETGPIVPGMMKDANGFNLTAVTQDGQFIGSSGDWGGGKVALHTPSAEVDADRTSVIRWTAPRNMMVDVDGGMWRLTLPDETDRRHQYELRHGQTVLASGTIDELGFGANDTNSANPESFSVNSLSVSSGDVLELRISPLDTGGGPLTADFDNSGTVDAGDLVVWQNSFGVDDGADADGDGVSDGRDFLTWQREFGMTGNGSAEASFIGVDLTVQESLAALAVVVPEPATTALLLSVLISLPLRRWR